jgi:tRNA (uracil-5-)-methyltransferase
MATEATSTSRDIASSEKVSPPVRPRNPDQDRHIRGKKRKLKASVLSEGSHDEVLSADVRALLAKLDLNQGGSTKKLEQFEQVEVTIDEISSTGDGLGHVEGSSRIFAVPFTSAGDIVQAKYIREDTNTNVMITDFLEVVKPSPLRDDSLVKCPYFSKCSGCQFQMLPYPAQLAHKKTIVEKAYRNFSGLPAVLVPAVGDTMGSPLQYGYRTKLTPHFDGPPGGRKAGRKGERAYFTEVPPIGFMQKGTRKTLDIEECPIGTDAVQMGLRRERKRVVKDLDTFKKGVTILLRESTQRTIKSEPETSDAEPIRQAGLDEENQTVYEDRGPYVHAKTCISDPHATSTEYVEDFIFENNANSFFQNNNSILPSFTEYIRSQIIAPLPTSTEEAATDAKPHQFENFIDAYSGSGLFTITLSSLFKRSIGIDIDASGIKSARRNAQLNSLQAPASTTSKSDQLTTTSSTAATSTAPTVEFIAATASELFSSVSSWSPSQTVVVCDPPRKGCDESFLRQLLTFGPARIVYVSCNVHTQARDIGFLLRNGKGPALGEGVGKGEVLEGTEGAMYELETLRGFDFFPQTGHVESVATLRRKI